MHTKLLRNLALVGNALYILWILFNALDERGQGVGRVQAVALIGLVVLLALNFTLIYRKR